MRLATPETNSSACYGAGTRVGVHRSRYELESVLSKYGADDVLLVEADATAAVQFAMHGRYVQLAFPLPDPQDARFTHTPSGKVRAASARERAYDQALREHWRSLIVAVRGKLQSVESGISTFEQEFDRFLVPQLAAEKKRDRRAARAVNWLLGGSHAAAIVLVAAFLVPASAVSAFALPTNVVGQLAAPFRSAITDESAAAKRANGVALARGGWSPSAADADVSSPDGGRLLVLRTELLRGDDSRPRQTADLSSPPSDPVDAPPGDIVPARASTVPSSNPQPPASSSTPADDSDGGWTLTSPPSNTGESQPPSDTGSALEPTTPSDPPADDSSDDASPPPGDSGSAPPSDDPSDPGTPPDDGGTTPPGNGNGKGNGNGNGNGNGPGNGQGNGQGLGLGQGNGQGNGKGKGGT
jgi:hypothetical protein